jgi:hypothetical protein
VRADQHPADRRAAARLHLAHARLQRPSPAAQSAMFVSLTPKEGKPTMRR